MNNAISWTDSLRVFRYVGSRASAAVVPAALVLVCKFARYRIASIGKWTFFGPDAFVSLFPEAQALLEAADPELLRALARSKYKVFFDEKTFGSCPSWRFGIVSRAYVAWGAEGLATAMVYFWFHVLSFREAGNWAVSLPSNSRAANRRAKDETRAWLTRHDYSPELCAIFEPQAGRGFQQDTSE
jgi:hypothetical protein